MYRVKSVIHGRGTRSSAGNSNRSVPYEYDPNTPENKSAAQLKLDLADRFIKTIKKGSTLLLSYGKSLPQK